MPIDISKAYTFSILQRKVSKIWLFSKTILITIQIYIINMLTKIDMLESTIDCKLLGSFCYLRCKQN